MNKIPKCLFCVKSNKFKCIAFNAHLSVFTGNLVIVIHPLTVDVVVILNSGPGRTFIGIVNFISVYIQSSRNYIVCSFCSAQYCDVKRCHEFLHN